jgi:hypothetical protein
VTRKQGKAGPSALKEDHRVQRPPEFKGQVWDCHLLTAGTSDGQTFEIMPIVDESTRECLATLVKRKIGEEDVTDCLFDLIVLMGAPGCIRSGNGAGSMAKAIGDWLRQTGVEAHSVKWNSNRNSGGGDLSGKLKDEVIEKTTFTTLPEAKAAIEDWRQHHNETMRRHATRTEEASQSPRLLKSTGGVSDGVRAPQQNPPAGQVERGEVAGLPGSPGLGAEFRQSMPAPLSSPGTVDNSQSIPRRNRSTGQVERGEVAGLPGPRGRESNPKQSIPNNESLYVEPGDGQSGPLDSAVGQVEPNQAGGLAISPGAGSEAHRLIDTYDSPCLGAGGSIPEKDPGIGQIEVTLFQVKVMVRSPRRGGIRRSKSTRLPRWPALMVANMRARVTGRLGIPRRRRALPRNRHPSETLNPPAA